jgi:Xaa-Pro aminopeptidase
MPLPLPAFSETERDRRWRETREQMAAQGIDALALPPAPMHHGDPGDANHRYLSQVGGDGAPVGMVFPRAGEPTVVLSHPDQAAHWRALSWTEDLRGSEGGRYGKVLSDRLKELKLQSGVIGVPHLECGPGSAESPVPSGALAALRTELPDARFVDTTALLDDQRAVKSDEEIAMLERASTIAERGILMLTYRVHVGMLQTEALAILEGAMLEAGCELGNQIRWECARRPSGAGWRPSHEQIRRGDVIQNDVEARVAGYGAREVHPISLGKPDSQVQEMFSLSARIFSEALPLLKPAVSVASVVDFVRRAGEATPYRTSLASHGPGRAREGFDTSETPRPPADAQYHERQVVSFRPVVGTDDGMRISFGATVVVTPTGGRRLGQRGLELLGSHRTFLAPYLAQRSEELPTPWSPVP